MVLVWEGSFTYDFILFISYILSILLFSLKIIVLFINLAIEIKHA